MNSTGRSSASVKSARRALEVLELLTDREAALTFPEIADALGYPRSSLHGLLRTLEGSGWIELDARRRYTLGIRAWQAGMAYRRVVGLAERARPFMEEVRDALDETVQLATLDESRYNVYIAKVEGAQLLVLESRVGRRLEAHATGVGKVLLAGLPPEELARRIGGVPLERFTDHTITDHGELRAELERIRRDGFALDNEEYTAGVRCVAVPVRDDSGAVVAGMSVSVPVVRFDEERCRRATDALLEAAGRLSETLGHRPGEPPLRDDRRGPHAGAQDAR